MPPQLFSLYDIVGIEQDKLRRGVQPERGLPSGIGLEILVPGGIPRDKVTTVFSDEGTFKTTLVTQIAYSAALSGPVVVVTLEDSAELCAHRLLGRISGVSFGRIHGGILTASELQAVSSAERTPQMKNIYLVDEIEPTMERCLAAALAVPGCQALIVDYIQLLDGDQKTTIENAMKAAQLFAKKHRIAVIIVSQRKTIDMEGQRRDNPRPVTGDMFGSAALRMGTKLAVGLFRPWSWSKAPTLVKGPYGLYTKWMSANPAHIELYPNILEVHCTKQVAGPPGAYWVLVEPETGIITPYDMRAYI